MMQIIQGSYFYPGQNRKVNAELRLDDSHFELWQTSEALLITSGATNAIRLQALVPGLPAEWQLADGALFCAADVSYRPARRSGAGISETLEQNRALILASLLLLPLLGWWWVIVGMPAAAERLVPLFPDKVYQITSSQTLNILDQLHLEPSKLPAERQHQYRQQWLRELSGLESLLPAQGQFRIEFRDGGHIGANAFALPDGTIVFTDQLIELLQDKPDALLAVLLHEAGHSVHRHGMQLLARSLASTMLLTLVTGDLEGIADTMIGSGTALIDAAFSRDMERQADLFSAQQLIARDKSPAAFADAISALSKNSDSKDRAESLLRYLSSHPSHDERINTATKLAEKPQ